MPVARQTPLHITDDSQIGQHGGRHCLGSCLFFAFGAGIQVRGAQSRLQDTVDRRFEAVRLAGSLEQGSTHPVARSVTTYAEALGALPAVGRHDAVRGSGVVGDVDGRAVRVGRPDWIGLDPSRL